MPFVPKYSRDEVDRIVSAGDLSPLEVYRLRHQHPLNQLTHVVGIPTVGASIAYPIFAWFAWGNVAWKEWLVLSTSGWGLQFLGHAIEGNRPAFLQDPRHFLIGPLFFICKPLFWLYPRLTGRSFLEKRFLKHGASPTESETDERKDFSSVTPQNEEAAGRYE
jgi:uncharacterized membrane protein YGL010W